MSFFPGPDPVAGDAHSCRALKTVVVPRTADLGDGFTVRRALPSREARMVGPFVFLDHMGPTEFRAGSGLDVRPHPHIGLATVTYLFEGEIVHRDTLGSALAIRPGDVNLMTAGRGIAHSERTDAGKRAGGGRLHGLQMWVGLPAAKEEMEPGFVHRGKHELPFIETAGARVRLVLGSAYGARSQAATASDTLFADAVLDAGASLPLDPDHEERAIYLVEGEVDIAGDSFGPGRLLVFRPGDRITVRAKTPTRMGLVGGAALEGPRHIWWNFVYSRKERIEEAKADWAAGRFGKVPGDETEFIPLPQR